jgi:hypothetical protein
VRDASDVVRILDLVRPGDGVEIRIRRVERDASGRGLVADAQATLVAD